MNNCEAILNRKYMEMMKLLNIYLNHFPKFEKYALCNIIRNTAYHLYDLITECQKRYYKKTSLTELDITHQKLRMQVYLANELGYFNFRDGSDDTSSDTIRRFIAISSIVDEIGKIIGGWIKKIREVEKF